MKKFLFVDGNHLVHRCSYVHQDLAHNGKPVGAVFGVFKSLLKCKRDYPLHQIVICWDGGHALRDELSRQGVVEGIVPETYKENRIAPQDEQSKLIRWQINEQWEPLKEGISYTTIQQVMQQGYEADDVIATYVLSCEDPAVILTSDKDYFQLLEPGVTLVDPIKGTTRNLDTFREEFGLNAPIQWVDVCALTGDDSDNIFGVPGVGEKTACKLISQYNSADDLITALKQDQAKGRELPKRHAAILEYERRVMLALQLKAMISEVPDLPVLKPNAPDEEKLIGFFQKMGFDSLMNQTEGLC